MAFKKMRGIRRSYEEQGYIYFLCRTYHRQPEDVKSRIKGACDVVGGEYADILFAVLTSGKTVREISQKKYLSESAIYELRKRFYETWKM